jgi:hypothetical protein
MSDAVLSTLQGTLEDEISAIIENRAYGDKFANAES